MFANSCLEIKLFSFYFQNSNEFIIFRYYSEPFPNLLASFPNMLKLVVFTELRILSDFRYFRSYYYKLVIRLIN